MDPYIIGNLLGVVLIFGWIPYKCYYTGKFVASALTNAFQGETRPEPSKKDPLPPKNSYPTISSYNEEHRITNPVEFDA